MTSEPGDTYFVALLRRLGERMQRFRRVLCAVPIVLAVAISVGSARAALDASAAALAPPVASDDILTTPQNTPGIVFPSFSDPDGDEVTITSAAPTAEHGTVFCDEFSCTYTPDLDYLGPDSFDYTVSDGTSTATGTITVEVVEPTANLSLAKTDSVDPVAVGSLFTYTVTVDNNGPADAQDVVVTDTLPSGLVLDSATSNDGECNESAGTVTCDLGTLVVGAGASIDIVVGAPTTGTFTNTASVTSSTPDPIGEDNSAVEPTSVLACPALGPAIDDGGLVTGRGVGHLQLADGSRDGRLHDAGAPAERAQPGAHDVRRRLDRQSAQRRAPTRAGTTARRRAARSTSRSSGSISPSRRAPTASPSTSPSRRRSTPST